MAVNISDLATTLESTLSNLPPQHEIQDADRMRLLGALNKIQTVLEPPQVSIQRFCFSHYVIVVIRIAQGMGIFDAFAESQGAELTTAELSSKTQGDEMLLKRIMRFLCAQNIFKQTASDKYSPAPVAMALGNGAVPGDMIKHFHFILQTTAKLFEYFEATGYKNPEDSMSTPFQLAQNTSDHYFEWLSKNPPFQQIFNSVMTGSQQYRGEDWFELYPVEEKLQTPADRTLLVDIGGGVGHDTTAFKKQFPDLPGKLVVQDLPQVIDTISEPLQDGITAMGYNMFDAQPVRGAKAYYMRTVLHDFPEKDALAALARIHDAMLEDSILLIHEHTIPDGLDVPPLAATLDLHMMELFASLERTEEQWVALIQKAGFKVIKVWKGKADGQSSALFEATL